MKLYPYNQGSESAKALANALGIKRLKREGAPIQVKGGLINWGCSAFVRNIAHDGVFNSPDCVKIAANKLQSFKALDGRVSIPQWTESLEEAKKWLAEGAEVVVRQKLNGHSGEGIIIASKPEDLVQAPLYTKYVPKQEEYRIHVFRDKAFFVQRKARKNEVPKEEVNWKVRNLKGGFIYANQDVVADDRAKAEAVAAIAALGLDFGAVDIIWNQRQNKFYVLEVNTACGLAGTTLEKYVEVFKEFV